MGCGAIWRSDWDSIDREDFGQMYFLDLTAKPASQSQIWGRIRQENDKLIAYQYPRYDMILAHHVLNEIPQPLLPQVMLNLHSMLKDGGVLRVSVPDLIVAFHMWEQGQDWWFPTGDKATSIDERFCGYVTWFGTNLSVFTQGRLLELGINAGFEGTSGCLFKETTFGPPEIVDLDDRADESLFWEYRK